MKKVSTVALALCLGLGPLNSRAEISTTELLGTGVVISALSHMMVEDGLQAIALGFFVHNSYNLATFHVPFIESLPEGDSSKMIMNHKLRAIAANVFGQSVGALLGIKLRPVAKKLCCYFNGLSCNEKMQSHQLAANLSQGGAEECGVDELSIGNTVHLVSDEQGASQASDHLVEEEEA